MDEEKRARTEVEEAEKCGAAERELASWEGVNAPVRRRPFACAVIPLAVVGKRVVSQVQTNQDESPGAFQRSFSPPPTSSRSLC